jgi:geranylgeranyl diphosphate synthase type II
MSGIKLLQEKTSMTVSCIKTSELPITAGNNNIQQSHAGPFSQLEQQLNQVRELMERCLAEVEQGPAKQASEYQINTGGSLLRARLALISGMAFNASPDYRIAAGAACELVHNASLVHDDLCDGDAVRRNRATVWKRYGKSVALCSGDLLLCAAFNATCQVADAGHARELTRLVAQLTSSVIVGQSLEVAMKPGSHKPGFREYLQATRTKTAPLIQLPLASGAIVSHDNQPALHIIERFAGAVGLAYQILDDLDDLQLAQPNLHRFHAWHFHQVPGDGSKATRIDRAIRHALAALQRARSQLTLLAAEAPRAFDDQLYLLIEQLQAKALLKGRSINCDKERTAHVNVRNSG